LNTTQKTSYQQQGIKTNFFFSKTTTKKQKTKQKTKQTNTKAKKQLRKSNK